MKKLTLTTRVGDLAANLYLPQGSLGKSLPLIIVSGAWTTVKEQMPGVYAKKLSEKGVAALTFDFRGWGESLGEPQFLEDPVRKTEDIRAVVAAAGMIEELDSSAVFLLGICASAGYVLDAASNNSAVSGAAVVAPWLHNHELACAIYGGEDSVSSLIELGNDAAKSEEPCFIEAASMSNENALMYQAPYYTELGRGLIPQYDNQFNVASWPAWLNYDALAGAEKQDKPVLMVASEAMALPSGAKQYLSATGDNVQAIWLDEISQFDFYDEGDVVTRACDELAKHFESIKPDMQ